MGAFTAIVLRAAEQKRSETESGEADWTPRLRSVRSVWCSSKHYQRWRGYRYEGTGEAATIA